VIPRSFLSNVGCVPAATDGWGSQALNKLFAERQSACANLEAAGSQLLRRAVKAWRVKQVKHKAQKKLLKDEEKQSMTEDMTLPAEPTMSFLDQLVPQDARPKHRIGFWGIFGKVDFFVIVVHSVRSIIQFETVT